MLRVSGKNLEIGEALQAHARVRVGAAIARYFDREAVGHMTLQPDGSGLRADMVLHMRSGITLQSEGRGHDPYATVNQAVERLETRLRRHKRRITDRHAAHKARPDTAEADDGYVAHHRIEAPEGEEVEAEFAAVVVAEPGVPLRQMTVSAAVLELDLSGVPVLLFRHAQTAEINVVYRRSDGHVGWIDPSKPGEGPARAA